MSVHGDQKKACWNCALKRRQWYVSASDSFCPNCGVKNPYVDRSDEVCNIIDEIAKSKKEFKRLLGSSSKKFSEDPLEILGGTIGGILGGIAGPMVWHAISNQSGLISILGIPTGAIVGYIFVFFLPRTIQWIQVSTAGRRLNRWKQHKQRLIQSIHPMPLIVQEQALREEIDQLHNDISEIENRYSQIASAIRKDHKAERDRAIVAREADIASRTVKLWDIDRVRWINRYEHSIARREKVTYAICSSQLAAMRKLYKDGEQLFHNPRRNMESMEPLDKALLFCKAKISDLEVQKEAILLVEKTEEWKPLISDPYNITAKECDYRRSKLSEAAHWVENQIRGYRRWEASRTTPELRMLVSALEGVLQSYKTMQEELGRAAFRLAVSNRDFAESSTHSDAFTTILERHDTILAEVNAHEAAISEIALLCEGEIDRLRTQQKEFTARRELDTYQVKPTEVEPLLQQVTISR